MYYLRSPSIHMHGHGQTQFLFSASSLLQLFKRTTTWLLGPRANKMQFFLYKKIVFKILLLTADGFNFSPCSLVYR